MSMIHEITSVVPRLKRAKRKGRGDSSGKGKTAGRGTKGSGARNGKYIRRGYEGGQTGVLPSLPEARLQQLRLRQQLQRRQPRRP